MLDFLRQIKKPKYEPFNRIEILQSNILHNYNYLKSIQPNIEIFPVLKSNAYGHGLKQVCCIFNQTQVKFLAVDSFPEVQIAYKYSNKKILIISEMALGVYKYSDFKRTEYCVYNLKTLEHLANLNKQAKIHLFINTGMNREGIQDLEVFLSLAEKFLSKTRVVGFCSHLASADGESNLNQLQLDKFIKNLNILKKYNISPRWLHLGNSAACFTLRNRGFKGLNAVRSGIALYGYNPFKNDHAQFKKASRLKPALRVFSKLVAIQKVKPGDRVSYNEKFVVHKPTQIGIIPFGYAEGLDRRLLNRAKFLVKTKDKKFFASVAGNVCMNLTCLDCGHEKIQIGDEVEIISDNPSAHNSIQNLAKLMNIIPYELLVKLRGDIRREIV